MPHLMLQPSIVRPVPALLVLLAALAAPGAGAAAVAEPQALATVRAAAESQVRARLQGVAYRVYVQPAELDPHLHLAHCPTLLVATMVGDGELHPRVTVRVSCPAGSPAWSVYVPVTLESDVPVLVLRRAGARGAHLDAEAVSVETRRVAGLGSDYWCDLEALPHRSLTRAVPAGTVLTAELLQADYLIRQGQTVTLVASSPGIEVRAPARALEDGREGSRVRVQNLESMKTVQGVVDASGLIHVTP